MQESRETQFSQRGRWRKDSAVKKHTSKLYTGGGPGGVTVEGGERKNFAH